MKRLRFLAFTLAAFGTACLGHVHAQAFDLYWTEQEVIKGSDIDGTNDTVVFDGSGMSGSAVDIAVTDDHIFWSENPGGRVWRADRNGGNAAPFIEVGNNSHFFAIDEENGFIYFTDFFNGIYRANLADGEDATLIVDRDAGPDVSYLGLALQETGDLLHLTGSTNDLFEAGTTEGSISASIGTLIGHQETYGLALSSDGETIYYSDWGENGLYTYNMNTQENEQLDVGLLRGPLGIKLSPSEEYLLIADRNEGIIVYELATGEYGTVTNTAAVHFGLAVAADPASVPDAPDESEPVPPIEDANVLILTSEGEEDLPVHLGYADILTDYFPGMSVTRSSSFAGADPLSDAQLAELATYDLIVLPRAVTREDYDSHSWHGVQAPLLNLNVWTQTDWHMWHRTSGGERWQFHMESVASEEGHEIFQGVPRMEEIPEDLDMGPNDELENFSPIGHYQMFTELIIQRRVLSEQQYVYGNFLGYQAGDTRRSFLTVWRGGEPYGNTDHSSIVGEGGSPELLPTPAQARAALMAPGEDGDPDLWGPGGMQLLLNTANWLIGHSENRPHAVETFELYPFSGTLTGRDLSDWEANAISFVNLVSESSPEGESPNAVIVTIDNDAGWGQAGSAWRPLYHGPRSDDVASLVDWTFKVRFNDASLDDVSTSIALGEDTGQSMEDNMRQGNAAAIGIYQDGGSQELRYIGSGGTQTAIGDVQIDDWYEVSMTLDLAEEVYNLEIRNMSDDTQSFSVEEVPFIGSVNTLDYVAIFSDSASEAYLDISMDDILVSSRTPIPDLDGFDAWRAAHFPENATNDEVSGPDADPDGDGVANLMEYFLGGNPNVADHSIRPTVERVDGDDGQTHLQIEFIRDPDAAGVEAVVERSDDLIDWTPVAGPHSSDSIEGMVVETWRDSEPVEDNNRSFLRLTVEQVD